MWNPVRMYVFLAAPNASRNYKIAAGQKQGDLVWLGEALERRGKIDEAAAPYARGKALLAGVRAAGSSDMRVQTCQCAPSAEVSTLNARSPLRNVRAMARN